MTSLMSRKATTKNSARKRPRTAKKRDLADDFVSVARRLGADEDKATFEAKLAKIAKAKPK